MKKVTLLYFTILVFIFSCKKENTTYSISDFENIELSPVKDIEFSIEQLAQIDYIHNTFREVYPISLEETINNFKRDKNPDNEIGIWMNMVESYRPFAEKHKKENNLSLRKEAFKLILMRSMMPNKEAIEASELEFLSKEQIEDILESYNSEAKPLTIEKK